MITKRSNHIPMFTTMEITKVNTRFVLSFLDHMNWGLKTLQVIMDQ